MQSKWTQYLQEKSEVVNVTVTTDDEGKGDAPVAKAEKKAPFGKKEDKGDSPFPKKDKGEKKDNPFAAKKDKKESPFAKKSEDDGDDKEEKSGKPNPFEKKGKGEKKNPFVKEWTSQFPSWNEWVSTKE